MPRVSIVISTYNGGKFIERALKSVINQTFRDFEVLVVDDASNDDTKEKVRNFVYQDPRFQLIELRENSGGGAVPRTIGCKASHGEFVAFLDQDDLYMPDYLEKKIVYLNNHPKINFLSSLAWTFDDKTREVINCEYGGPVNTMVRREVLEKVNYFKDFQTNVDDVGMWYRYIKAYGTEMSISIPGAPITLYAHHINQGSYTKNKDPHIFIKRIDSILVEIGEVETEQSIKNLVRYLYMRKANFYCLAGDFKNGRLFFKKAWKLKFSLSPFILWIIGFSPIIYSFSFFLIKAVRINIFTKARVFLKKHKYIESYRLAKTILKM